MTLNHNYVTFKGETFTAAVRYKNPAGETIDLNGFTAHLDICGADGVIHTYPASAGDDGWISWKVTDEETTLWPSTASYRLVLESPDGDVLFLLTGLVTAREWVQPD